MKTNSLLTLIEQSALKGTGMPQAVRLRAQAPPAYPPQRSEPLDEFSNAERIALRDAARDAVRALEARLARGRALLARSVDPREGGWHEPENLVWAATHSWLLTVEVLEPQFPQNVLSWPAPVKALLPAGPDGTLLKRGFRYLVAELSALLFPTEMDLQAFRVLLLLGMSDTSPEELHGLKLPDIEFTDGGVRLVQRKSRARRVRADVHPDPDPGPGEERATEFAGDGTWGVPGLLRRLLAATELYRKVFPETEPWLFLAVERRHRGVLDAEVAQSCSTGTDPAAGAAPVTPSTRVYLANCSAGCRSPICSPGRPIRGPRSGTTPGPCGIWWAGRPARAWIIEPVAEALTVLEQLSWHPTHLFVALAPPTGKQNCTEPGIQSEAEIDFFINGVNTIAHQHGLAKIPPSRVRSHMFRKTMSQLAGREPDSEIALGLQLKHAARRAFANRTTQAYAQMDASWAKEFDTELQQAAARKLVDLLRGRRQGERVAVGPGAARLHAGLDKVIATIDNDPQLRAQIADERVEEALLADEFPNLHLGTVNHCMFDALQAECRGELPEDQRGLAPLIGACQPARCRTRLSPVPTPRTGLRKRTT